MNNVSLLKSIAGYSPSLLGDWVPHKACTFAGGGADGYGEPEQQGVVGVYLVCVGAKAAPGRHSCG